MKSPPISAPARFDSLEQQVFLSLWRTYDRLRALEDSLFVAFDLTAQQYNVLRLLKADYPKSVQTLALAERLISRAPDITRMLDKLERRNLISRERPADNRRIVRVQITHAGLALVKDVAGPLQACHKRQLGHMPQSDLEDLARLLHDARLPHEDQDSPWR